MTDRPAILSAKVQKLAEIVADGNATKDTGSKTVSEARQAQKAAVEDVLGDHASVASVEQIPLPSER